MSIFSHRGPRYCHANSGIWVTHTEGAKHRSAGCGFCVTLCGLKWRRSCGECHSNVSFSDPSLRFTIARGKSLAAFGPLARRRTFASNSLHTNPGRTFASIFGPQGLCHQGLCQTRNNPFSAPLPAGALPAGALPAGPLPAGIGSFWMAS